MTKETAANSVVQALLDLMKSNFEKIGNQLIISESHEGPKEPKKPEEEPQKMDSSPRELAEVTPHDPLRKSQETGC